MKRRIIVSAIVCNSNQQILLGKKKKGQPPYPNVWHLVGGGIEDLQKGEELLINKKFDDNYFHEELKREVVEEASLKIKNIKNICPKFREVPREAVNVDINNEETHYTFLEYLCEVDSGVPKPGDDLAELYWHDKSQLKNLKLTPPSVEMYKELGWT